MNHEPLIETVGRWRRVRGLFFREVDAAHVGSALAGSRRAGRYSRADQPTLYLSASPEGVAAAMIAHANEETQPRALLSFEVEADKIFDLRQPEELRRAGFNVREIFSEWQSVTANGGSPESWRVRAWIEATGANGLIDPSRKAPGLWHLVLFRWNVEGGAKVLPLP